MRQKENAGKSMTIHVIPKIVAYAFPKAMTPSNIMSGFKATGIFPFDKNVISSDQFMSAYSTDKMLENAVIETNRPQEQSTQSFSEREMTIASTSSAEQVRPFGKWPARKENATKRRKGRSRVFTDTPVRQAIEEEHAKRKTKSKLRKNIMFSGAQKSNPDNSKKKKQNTASKHISSSDESESKPDINLLFDNESIADENDDLERQNIRCPTAEQLEEDDHILVMFPGKKSVR